MKIGIIKRAVPIPGADVINTLSLAQGIFNLGHDVEVLAIEEFKDKLWKIKIGDVHRFFQLNYNIKFRYFKGSFLFYLRNFNFIRGIINFLTLFPKIYDFINPEIKISKYCIKNKFDLLICRDTFKAAYHSIINKIPIIIDLHGFRNIYEAKYLVELKNNEYFRGIITLNDFLKNKFIKLGFSEKKILVMDNAINLNEFNSINIDKTSIRKKLNLPLYKNLILYSGSVQDDRGIDTILHSSEFLNKEQYVFYFIGGIKKANKKWEKYIIKNKIDSDIHFIGLKGKKFVPYYLKAADVLLATFSPNCPTLEFMSPVKIFEYMASKTPIIATKIGRNIEICNNNECLFTIANDPIDLSEKIRLLINDKDLQDRLIQNAYNKAKNQTFNKRCKMILGLM